MGMTISNTIPEDHRIAILDHLDQVLESRHFRNSRKYPNFLRYVVEKKLANDHNLLKERTLGIEVFNRALDYDTSNDPVVRVTAGEVRKRLAQYYQEGSSENSVSISLPIGSYVPEFKLASRTDISDEEISPQEDQHTDLVFSSRAMPDLPPRERRITIRVRTHLFYVGLLLLLCVAGIVFFHFRQGSVRPNPSVSANALDILWAPLLKDPMSLILYSSTINQVEVRLRDVKESSIRDRQNKTELVPASTSFVGMAVFTFLINHNKAFIVKSGSQADFFQFQNGPSAVLGLADDLWIKKFTEKLPFHFSSDSSGVMAIEDHSSGRRLASLNLDAPYGGVSTDYAIVARVRDPDSNQWMIIAAGVGEAGMYAAGRFLRNPAYSESLLQEATKKWTPQKNVEIVLSAHVIDGVGGTPKILTTYTW